MTATQLVTVSEITQETLAKVEAGASSLTAEQEVVIVADTVTWATIRNKVKTEIDGGKGGVSVKTRRLIDEIRMRTRNAFGWPLYSEQTYPTSGALANQFVF